jgi:hypothetical protein
MTLRTFLGLAIGFVIFGSFSRVSALFGTTVVIGKQDGSHLRNRECAETATLPPELEHR